MNSKTSVPSLVLWVVVLAGISIVLLAMRAAGGILSPVLAALMLVMPVAPLLGWLIKKGAPAWLALVLTAVPAVVLVMGIVWLVGLSVQEFSVSLPAYQQRFAEIERSLGSALTNFGVNVDNLAADRLIAPAKWLELAANFCGGVVSGLSNWGLVLLASIFFLVEATIMPAKLQNVAQLGDTDDRRSLRVVQDIRRYMAINGLFGLLAAVCNVILLAVIGVDFALLWGVLSFFMSFVPSVGFLISLIPPAVMALIQFGVPQMMIVVVAYIVINFVVDSVVKPRFIQKSLGISYAVAFLFLILWGWVLGPIGAILAVPMAMIVKAILESRKETRWLAYLMGDGSEPFKLETEHVPDVAEVDVT
jgi:AI-2 transport protein TqsA